MALFPMQRGPKLAGHPLGTVSGWAGWAIIGPTIPGIGPVHSHFQPLQPPHIPWFVSCGIIVIHGCSSCAGTAWPWKGYCWLAIVSEPFPLDLPFRFPERDKFPRTAPLEGDKITMKERAVRAQGCEFQADLPKLTTTTQCHSVSQSSKAHRQCPDRRHASCCESRNAAINFPAHGLRCTWVVAESEKEKYKENKKKKEKWSDPKEMKEYTPELNSTKNRKTKKKMVSIQTEEGNARVLHRRRFTVGCAARTLTGCRTVIKLCEIRPCP